MIARRAGGMYVPPPYLVPNAAVRAKVATMVEELESAIGLDFKKFMAEFLILNGCA